ncbi:MAG: T9SS type A sorting domain-containing protein, partial [Spirosoma sp.]|nr:T9SS type A sorting domain-containing protein [Spirosoma sp.]
FTDAETPGSLTLSVSGLPAGLNFVPPATISGTPSVSGVSSVTVKATDPGSLTAGNTFSITVSPASVVVVPPGSQTACRSSVVVLNATTTGVRYEWYKNGTSAPFKLTEIASIQKGTATSSLTVVSVQTTASYYVKVFQANNSFTFDGPFVVTVNYGCTAPARVAASEVAEVPLTMTLTPNPLVDGQLRAVVRGAAGQALSAELVDVSGRTVKAQVWPVADAEQVVAWDVTARPSGMYILRVQTGKQRQALKVVKPD